MDEGTPFTERTQFTEAVTALIALIAKTPEEDETMRRQWYERERLFIVYRHPDDDHDRGKILFIDPQRVHIADEEGGSQ